MTAWNPCELINQCFIKELADCENKPYLVTYVASNGRRYVKKTNIYRGRVQSNENRIIAYMPLPEPYQG